MGLNGADNLKQIMRLIARYKELSAGERRLFVRALILVLAVRVALWTLPFRIIRTWVDRLRKPAGPWRDLERRHIRQVAWAVEAASRRVPGATCLTQGMAVQVLLGRLGQHSELRLGVARKPNGEFSAHAWVEAQGRVVNGGAIEEFKSFVRLEERSS
jgi:hypothetical protein